MQENPCIHMQIRQQDSMQLSIPSYFRGKGEEATSSSVLQKTREEEEEKEEKSGGDNLCFSVKMCEDKGKNCPATKKLNVV